MAVFDNIKGIGVASGFKLQAESALDPRLTVATVDERDELVTGNGAYEGMSVYVKANKKTYQLQGKTNADWVDVTSEAASTSALENEIKTARGDENTLGERLDFMYASTQTKQDKFTVGNGLTLPFDEHVLSLVLDPAEDNALTNSSTGLKVVVPEGKDYTVTVDTTKTTDGAAKSYTLKQLGKNIAVIDIPKDMVVSGGVVETYTDETAPVDPSKTDGSKLAAGTYIVLTIANKAKDKLYIPADGLVEYVTSGSKTGDPIIVTVDPTTHKVTATLSDKGITTAKIADGAITTAKLATNAVATANIKDGAITEVKLAKAVTDKLAKTNLVVDGTTKVKGIVKLSSTIADDETMAATPKAVNSVKDIADTAATNASTAKSDAAAAKSTATEAKNTADTASETATTASTTATEAKELATTADGNATKAKNTASTANVTATNAKNTADAAKKTAEAAKSTAEGKVSVVWVAKGETVPTTAVANSLCFKIL